MKLNFELWSEGDYFSENARGLFKASADCYKAQVYTASLLMAYLGFLVVLKERVMRAAKPAIFPEGLWDNMILKLKDEDRWEEAIFDAAVQREKPEGSVGSDRTRDPVFVINDNLRLQIKYWKDRRNDCVHNKDNRITISHVESFWNFLESNLQKITIEGGKMSLLNKFTRHYDNSYTSVNESVIPLILEIKGAVPKTEMHDFWKSLIEIVTDMWDYSREIDLFKKILSVNDSELTSSLIDYVKSENNLLKAFINEHPTVIGQLGWSAQEIRNFWNKKLGPMQNAMGCYASMLRNGLIPAGEIAEANQKLACLYKYPSSLEDHYVLSANGFGEVIYNQLFVVNSPGELLYWKFMNKHYGLFTRYVEMYPLKNEVITILCQELGKEEWVSFFLRDSLGRLFTDNPRKKREFIDRAKELEIDLPSGIIELHQ